MNRHDLLQAVLAGVVSASLSPVGVGAAGTADVQAPPPQQPPPQPSPKPSRGTFTNPLPVALADPSVLRHGGTYYLYGTSAPSQGFHCWTSPDLVHWEAHPFAYRRTSRSWGRDHFWAPCVVEYGGSFLMYYSCVGPVRGGRTSHRICVARSDSPLGPFVDVRTPLLDLGYATIDAEVFVDADGRGYLYFSRDISENPVSEVYAVRLTPDLLGVAGDPVRCVRPSQRWEGGKWNEAPCVFRHGDQYVMTYSARCFADPLYGVGYATAPSPMGPWTKAQNNPILRRTDDVSGPGHNCVTRSPDGRELLIVYHTHQDMAGGDPRQLAVDRLWVSGGKVGVDGKTSPVRLATNGPTHTAQPMPSNVQGPVIAGAVE